MFTFTVPNVNHALPRALAELRDSGKRIAPRGQPTLELEGAVATVYQNPTQMVLFDPLRDANPFFHFFEALWILAGRNDVAFLAHFNKKMAEYSDDGYVFHAPYGFRLRHAWSMGSAMNIDPSHEIDQIEYCIAKLRADPDSRQCVMVIWDPQQDWVRTKDVPCNDMVMLKLREGALRMTVCNRSNDVVWGAYGANVVQFSTLLTYMARRIGVDVGTYTQISDSFHVYMDNPYWLQWVQRHSSGVPPVDHDFYNDLGYYDDMFKSENRWMQPIDFMGAVHHPSLFDEDLARFFKAWEGQGTFNAADYATDSFRHVVIPMFETHVLWKQKDYVAALGRCSGIEVGDWRLACSQWMMRRYEKIMQEARA